MHPSHQTHLCVWLCGTTNNVTSKVQTVAFYTCPLRPYGSVSCLLGYWLGWQLLSGTRQKSSCYWGWLGFHLH